MTDDILMDLESKLIIIQGEISKERATMSRILSEPIEANASEGELVARQNKLYYHAQKLHALETQYHAIEANIKKLTEKS